MGCCAPSGGVRRRMPRRAASGHSVVELPERVTRSCHEAHGVDRGVVCPKMGARLDVCHWCRRSVDAEKDRGRVDKSSYARWFKGSTGMRVPHSMSRPLNGAYTHGEESECSGIPEEGQ